MFQVHLEEKKLSFPTAFKSILKKKILSFLAAALYNAHEDGSGVVGEEEEERTRTDRSGHL